MQLFEEQYLLHMIDLLNEFIILLFINQEIHQIVYFQQ